jgi:hypothetical protein
MDTTKQPDSPPAASSPGYETRDVNLRLIIIALAGLSILVVISLIAMAGFFGVLANRQAGQVVPVPPLAASRQPPEPRLQASSRQDLDELRAAEDEMLHNYGWVNREAGVVRIPIERAKELVLERGLPTRSGE